jgi:tRNA 2-thiouridine synthesizing protein B
MLHTINTSPFTSSSLDACLRTAAPGSSLLFIEDGVYAVLQGTAVSARVQEAMKQLSVHVLGPDLAARGVQGKLMAGVNVVDYGGFVDLAAAAPRIQAWL